MDRGYPSRQLGGCGRLHTQNIGWSDDAICIEEMRNSGRKHWLPVWVWRGLRQWGEGVSRLQCIPFCSSLVEEITLWHVACPMF